MTQGEGKPSELKVMKSAAGWYIGRSYMEWGSPLPYSRDRLPFAHGRQRGVTKNPIGDTTCDHLQITTNQ